MRKLKTRKKDENSKYWQAKAMREWVRIVHARGKCAVCTILGEHHGSGRMEAHHLITRSAPSCRFDPKNGCLLCSWHHKFSTELSAHKAPLAFYMFLERHYPESYAYARRHSIYRPEPENDSKATAREWYETLVKINS